ncbi:MAG: OmpH family outer membrane protein [Planctomycetota bacterium]
MVGVRTFAMALLVAVMVTVSSLTSTVRAEEKRIAVVNVSTVFGRYTRVTDIQEGLRKEFETRQKSIEVKERQLKQWKEKMDGDAALLENPKKDKKLFEEQIKFQQAAFDFQNEYEDLLKMVEERRKNEMKIVLAEIRKAISTIGKMEKYDLVLRAPEYDGEFDEIKAGAADKKEEAVSAAELVRRFRDNPVLYFASGVNITENVVVMLNSDYKAGKK